MMQALLAERFSLKTHFETKEQPVHIVVAGKTGKRPPTGLQVTTDGSCVRVDSGGPPDPLPPDTPAIFAAVQEQLGLRLEPSKALIGILVIDYAERPSAN